MLSKSFIAGLDLPIGENRPDNRVVAFAVPSPSYVLESHTAGAVEQAYTAHHRTQIHEDLQEHGGWPTFLSLQMARNAKCRVPCRLIVARVGDKRFKEHRDGWINLIVHLVGEKRWWVRIDKGVDPVIVTTRPGDFLYMDEGVFHQACITEDSDRSVHLQVAVVTSIPLLVAPK